MNAIIVVEQRVPCGDQFLHKYTADTYDVRANVVCTMQ